MGQDLTSCGSVRLSNPPASAQPEGKLNINHVSLPCDCPSLGLAQSRAPSRAQWGHMRGHVLEPRRTGRGRPLRRPLPPHPLGLAALMKTPFNQNPHISRPNSGSLGVGLARLSVHMPDGGCAPRARWPGVPARKDLTSDLGAAKGTLSPGGTQTWRTHTGPGLGLRCTSSSQTLPGDLLSARQPGALCRLLSLVPARP